MRANGYRYFKPASLGQSTEVIVMKRRGKRVLLLTLLLLSAVPAAHAQFAVIDVASLGQLIQEVADTEQEIVTLQNQLRQAQQAYQAITGGRGMQNLLAGINRNYLPADWPSLMAAVNGGGPYPATAAAIRANIAANALLTPAQIALLSQAEQAQLTADRQTVALLQATVQQALATTSTRFASIQQLIAAIGGAADAKASMDLQARIAAEEGMAATDQSKLQVLYQAAQAQAWVQQQRLREQAIADIGSLRALPAMGL
jgi:type IV secretion system protein VirB5